MEKVYTVAVALPATDEGVVMAELANYLTRTGLFSHAFLWKSLDVGRSALEPSSWCVIFFHYLLLLFFWVIYLLFVILGPHIEDMMGL